MRGSLTTVRSPLMTRARPSDPTFSYIMMLLKISDVSLPYIQRIKIWGTLANGTLKKGMPLPA